MGNMGSRWMQDRAAELADKYMAPYIRDLDRDNFMSAQEAVEYGLIDMVEPEHAEEEAAAAEGAIVGTGAGTSAGERAGRSGHPRIRPH